LKELAVEYPAKSRRQGGWIPSSGRDRGNHLRLLPYRRRPLKNGPARLPFNGDPASALAVANHPG